MPAYNYECRNKDCEKFEVNVEVVKSFALSDEGEKCGVCGQSLKKLIGGFGVKYNCGGFYHQNPHRP